jgi:uncharacterized iron-regulated membrane protein
MAHTLKHKQKLLNRIRRIRGQIENRTLRSDVAIDGGTGAILRRVDFGQRQLVDRIVGVGVAAHEGHLFGWVNQLVSLLTASGLILVGGGAQSDRSARRWACRVQLCRPGSWPRFSASPPPQSA